MNPEDRLRETLRRAEGYAPSPDLFARVQRSIEEDAAHRRRVRRAIGAASAAVAALAVWFVATADVVDGRVEVPWWALEAGVDAVLVALVVVLGPVIRRFGETYAGDVFHASPPTGERFLRLFDVAYYLVFGGFVLVTARFAPDPDWAVLALGAQLEDSAVRLGGMLVLMGVLHGAAIVALPVVGLLFSSTWRRAARAELGDEAPPPSPRARVADRVATAIAWAFVVLAVLGALMLVLGVTAGLGEG